MAMAGTTLTTDQFDEFCGFVRAYASAAHQNKNTLRFESLNERLVANRMDNRKAGLSADEFDEYAKYAGSLGTSLQQIEPQRASRFFSLLELLESEQCRR